MRGDRRGSQDSEQGSKTAQPQLSHRPATAKNPLVASLLCAALLATALGAAPGLAAQPADSKLRQSAEELERIRSRMQSVGKTIETDRSQQDELQDAVEAAERKVADAQKQLRRLTQQIEAQDAKVHQAEAGRAAAETQLARQRELLARQLRAAFIVGQGGGKAEVLLNQDDPDRVDRLLTYYDYLNRARASTIADIGHQIEQVTAQQRQYQTELAALRSLQTEHQRAVVELDRDRVERAEAVAKIDARLRDETQEMKRLRDNEKQVQALLAKLREALIETPVIAKEPKKAFPEMRGQHDWPLRGPILAHYGEAKAGGKLQWKGLWIGAPEGAPVKATANGRVAYVGRLSSYGLIVVIEHEKGFFTLYGHNATVTATTGDSVDAGEVIAFAGNTGGYEETGLYFEVRRGTEPLDPTNWLSR